MYEDTWVLWSFALGATSWDYAGAISRGPMCHEVPHVGYVFESDKWNCNEVVA